MRFIGYTLLSIITISSSAQYAIKSIDYNTPFYQGGSPGNPFGLGLTLKDNNKAIELYYRVSGFNYGGFIRSSFYDSSSGYFVYDDRVVYQSNKGDSVLTVNRNERNSGIGIQAGVHRNFEIWTLPFFASVHAGLYAQKYDYSLSYSYTANSPDTSQFRNPIFDPDYSRGSSVQRYEDVGWTILPQFGLETGMVLSAGKRLQVIPKLVFNLSLIRVSGMQTISGPSIGATITPSYSVDLNGSAALQVSYLLESKTTKDRK